MALCKPGQFLLNSTRHTLNDPENSTVIEPRGVEHLPNQFIPQLRSTFSHRLPVFPPSSRDIDHNTNPRPHKLLITVNIRGSPPFTGFDWLPAPRQSVSKYFARARWFAFSFAVLFTIANLRSMSKEIPRKVTLLCFLGTVWASKIFIQDCDIV